MDAGSALRGLIGGLLIAAGVLVGLTGGVCGGLGVFWAFGNWSGGGQWDTLLLSIVGGGLSIAVGAVLCMIGRASLRSASGRSGDGEAAGGPDP